MIHRRRALLREFVADASRRVNSRLWHLPELARRRRIACYFAVNGEVDCAPIAAEAQRRARAICLPILRNGGLDFAHFGPESRLVPNAFGIPEPVSAKRDLIHTRDLDVVLAPLVAFDSRGNRLGMGGGYYDRSFAFLKHRLVWRRPLLIGLAYDFQRVARIPVQDWDVPLCAVVTPDQVHRFGQANPS